MSLYGLSGSDVVLACQWGNISHDGYHKCETCKEYYRCPRPAKSRGMRKEDTPEDCPNLRKETYPDGQRITCLNCPRPFFGTCNFFSGTQKENRSMRKENTPEDCPNLRKETYPDGQRITCLNCPRPFFGTCKSFSG